MCEFAKRKNYTDMNILHAHQFKGYKVKFVIKYKYTVLLFMWSFSKPNSYKKPNFIFFV